MAEELSDEPRDQSPQHMSKNTVLMPFFCSPVGFLIPKPYDIGPPKLSFVIICRGKCQDIDPNHIWVWMR
jgi:hypothetical protein